jgi:hypothetical protein
MAHLKKLSDRLAHKFIGKVMKIRRATDPEFFDFESMTESYGLSRKVRQLVVPSLKMTASYHGLASLSAM